MEVTIKGIEGIKGMKGDGAGGGAQLTSRLHGAGILRKKQWRKHGDGEG